MPHVWPRPGPRPRRRLRVRLTAHGRTLLPHAEETMARLGALVRELAAKRELTGSALRFGAFATADAALVPRAIAAFRSRHPGVTLTREEGLTPRTVYAATARGRALPPAVEPFLAALRATQVATRGGERLPRSAAP
ncbi:hypothetical protein [Streptomyces sp. NPDC048436]|uniref:hypothetical protein n=1 Tax=Streptomyces sp. NPDC048436 TaxID=3365550 RepID=UPI00371C0C2A